MMKTRIATALAVATLQLGCGESFALHGGPGSSRHADLAVIGGGASVGADVYNALCQRTSVRYYPSDLSGVKTRRLCRGEERADGTWPAGLEALDARRPGLVDALDQALAADADPADGAASHPARRFLNGLLAVHDSQTSARGIEGLARVLEDLDRPETLASLAEQFEVDSGPWGTLAAAVAPDVVADLWNVWASPREQWAPADEALRELAGQVRSWAATAAGGSSEVDAAGDAIERLAAVAGEVLFSEQPPAWAAVRPVAAAVVPAVGDLIGLVTAPSLRGAAGSELFSAVKPKFDATCDQGTCRRLAAALAKPDYSAAWQKMWRLLGPSTSSALTADLAGVVDRIAADPRRLQRLQALAERPEFARLVAGLTQWARFADDIEFDPSEEEKDTAASRYILDGRSPGPLLLGREADHRGSAAPGERSLLWRVLSMVHDANRLTLQNRDIQTLLLFGDTTSFSYQQGEIFRLDNLAHVFLRSLAGAATLDMCLHPTEDLDDGSLESMLFRVCDEALTREPSVGGRPPGGINELFGLPVSGRGMEIRCEPLSAAQGRALCTSRPQAEPWRGLRFRVDPGSASRMLAQALLEEPGDRFMPQLFERPQIDGADFISRHGSTFAALEVPGIAEGMGLLTRAFVGPEGDAAAEAGLTLLVELLEVLGAHYAPPDGPGLVDLEPLIAHLLPHCLFDGGPDDPTRFTALVQLVIGARQAADRWWATASAEDPALAPAAAAMARALPALLADSRLSEQAWADALGGVGRLWLALQDEPELRLEDLGATLRSPAAEATLRLVAILAAHPAAKAGIVHLINNLLQLDPTLFTAMTAASGRSLATELRDQLPSWLEPGSGPLVAFGDLVRAVRGSDAEAFVPSLTHRLARPAPSVRGGAALRAPGAVLAEAFVQVNRRDPAAGDTPLDAEDWGLILARLRDFLRDEQGGLRRFLAIVERRHG